MRAYAGLYQNDWRSGVDNKYDGSAILYMQANTENKTLDSNLRWGTKPKYGPVLDYVEASPSTGQVVFTASYSSGQSILNLMYSYRMDGTFSSSIFEKDGSSVIEYTKNGIVHYIMSNVNVRVAAWVNGTCECSITGPLTEQEMITIIDSIYT